jgi:hypothetical protein
MFVLRQRWSNRPHMPLTMRIGDTCLEVAKTCGMTGAGCEHVRVASITRDDIEAAVRAAWARDTCDPVDVDDWSPANPARGQCGTTALTIKDLPGGDLLVAEVLRADGSRQGVHWWKRLPDGTQLDLTHEAVRQPRSDPAAVRPERDSNARPTA